MDQKIVALYYRISLDDGQVSFFILRNPFYKSAHLFFRIHQKGIGSNTDNIIPHEEWKIIENCHEAIVFPEEWGKI